MKPSNEWKLTPDVLRELQLLPRRHRDDARAEAYLAMAEGRDPKNAIRAYRRKTRRWQNLR